MEVQSLLKVLGNLQVELAAKAGALRQMLLELLDHHEDIRKMTIMGRTCKMQRANGSIECSIPLDKQSAEGDKFYSHHLSTFFMFFCISTRMLPLSMSHRCCHVCRWGRRDWNASGVLPSKVSDAVTRNTWLVWALHILYPKPRASEVDPKLQNLVLQLFYKVIFFPLRVTVR